MFAERYGNVFHGPDQWQAIATSEGQTYGWDMGSTYIQAPPFFRDMTAEPGATDINGARRWLKMLGDSVTTDHISPAGAIKEESPAGSYLTGHQVGARDFNSYGSRRGNHEVMMRGTFANIRIRNEMVPGIEGGFTRHSRAASACRSTTPPCAIRPKGCRWSWSAARSTAPARRATGRPRAPGCSASRRSIAESFERIHRSNLIGMGVLPLQFKDGTDRKSLKLTGEELVDLTGIAEGMEPRSDVTCRIHRPDGSSEQVSLLCRIDTADELEYYRHGGILHYVLRNLMAA